MSSMYGNTGSINNQSSNNSRPTGGKIPSGYNLGQIPNFTPEQMQLFRSMFSQVGPDSYTGRLAAGDESLFNEMEAPALRQFNGILGGQASRFSGMGAGARNSSGFQNTINQASSDFAQQLQSRRQGLQRGAISDLQSMSSNLLGQRPYDSFLTPKKKSFLDQILEGLGPMSQEDMGNYAKIAAMFI